MKRIASVFLIAALVISDNAMTTTTVYADAGEDKTITAPFQSGYIPDGGSINLKLKSGFGFLDEPSEKVNWELALTGAALSKEVYDFRKDTSYDKVYDFPDNSGADQSESVASTVQNTLIDLGYTQTRYCYHAVYPSAYTRPVPCFGYKRYKSNGQTINVFVIIVRGTHGWSDIFTDALDGGTNFFTLATDSVRKEFVDFAYKATGKYPEQLKSEDNRFFLTGHSLGGAIANRLSITDTIVDMAGNNKNKIYTYTYEAPHNCKNYLWMDPKGMSNAINIKDVDDAVTNVPPWAGATRYGTDFEFSVGDNLDTFVESEAVIGGSYGPFAYLSSLLKHMIDKSTVDLSNRKVEYLDNQIFTTLFPNAKGGSVVKAPKIENFGNILGHHDMGLPLTYIIQKGIENNVWSNIGDIFEFHDKKQAKSSNDKPLEHIIVLAQHSVYESGLEYKDKYIYNNEGKQISIESYDSDGNICAEQVFDYDSDGNQIKWTQYDSDGNAIIWYEYMYDKYGNVKKETRYSSDGSLEVWSEYEYDNNGNLIKFTSSDINDLIIYHKYEYNSIGSQIKDSTYNNDGTLEDWTEYEYDKAGNEIKAFYHHKDGSVSWTEREYDSKGNQTKYMSYNSDGSISGGGEDQYEYNNSGNVIRKKRFDLSGNLYYKEEYKYDASGNLIQELGYNGDDSFVLRYEFEYDNAGSHQIRFTSYNEDGSKKEEYQYKPLSELVYQTLPDR